jgi:hypothetical protein
MKRLFKMLTVALLVAGGAVVGGSDPASADTCVGNGWRVTGGVSFQVSGAFNRQFMTGADIERCSDGTFIVHVYPGWAGRIPRNAATSANVVLQEVQARWPGMDARTRQSIWDQAYCHGLAPVQWISALRTWDLESYRGPAGSHLTMIRTLCGWYRPYA